MSPERIGLFLLPIAFILIDYGAHLLRNYEVRRREVAGARGKSLQQPYIPNLRIWGLGAVLGVASFLLTTWLSTDVTKLVTSFASGTETIIGPNDILRQTVSGDSVVLPIAYLVFVVAITGLILYAIVRVTKEE